MSFEIIRELEQNKELLKSLENIPFLKWNYIDTIELKHFKDNIKINKEYFVDWYGNTKSKVDIRKISGIVSKNELKDFIQNLIPYSFILQTKIKLTSPYFSRDDDEFYLIQNPALKEKVFKAPMIRGSGWKGAIAKAGKDLINKKLKNKEADNSNSIREDIASYLRIFGTGSEEFRGLEDMISKYLKDGNKLDSEKTIKFLLFELGLKLVKKDIDTLRDGRGVEQWLKSKLWEGLKEKNGKSLPLYLQVHKGRAIFYPTYFNQLSLEIINPHNRKTRAGTNPIHYEVVPENTEGILQIVYIPFDAVLENDKELKAQVGKDIESLTKCIERVAENGVGAKTKLGWGRFKFKERSYYINGEIEGLKLQNWEKCGVENGQ